MKRWQIFIILFGFLGVWGCSTTGPAPSPPPPRAQIPVYYYIGALEMSLKQAPDPTSNDVTTVRLNERVEMVKRRGSWFLVRTAGGQEGWANERNLKLARVSELYISRGGVRLYRTPSQGAATAGWLRVNDLVKLQKLNVQQGWAQVTVSRTQTTGWVQMKDLSLQRVTVYRRVRRPVQPAEPQPSPASTPGSQSPGSATVPGQLGPTPAEAAPPSKTEPKSDSHYPKAQPKLFEPF
jgi:uncharacterized protein YgiM (DUF1202 family)